MDLIFSDGNVEEKCIINSLKEELGINVSKVGNVYEARDDYGKLIAMSSQLYIIVKAVAIAYGIDI